jgi:hypothetical protein
VALQCAAIIDQAGLVGQLSDKPLLASLSLGGARDVKNQWQWKKLVPVRMDDRVIR